jgi:hypothetical protein
MYQILNTHFQPIEPMTTQHTAHEAADLLSPIVRQLSNINGNLIRRRVHAETAEQYDQRIITALELIYPAMNDLMSLQKVSEYSIDTIKSQSHRSHKSTEGKGIMRIA